MPLPKQLAAALLTTVVLIPAIMDAQEKMPDTPQAHYKLTYRLLQIGEDGKVTNSRTYVAIIGESAAIISEGKDTAAAKIRTGDKLPIPVKSGSITEFQYQDVGTDIDTFHPQINGRQLSLQVTAATSSVAKPVPEGIPNVPVFRQTRWESNVVVTLDKPTIIFTSDNVSDTGKTELELTATEIKQP
jgi:hypothetical protein